MKRRICIGLAACILCFVSVAEASFVQIDFNGMTGGGGNLAGQTGGTGLGVWAGDSKLDVMSWDNLVAPAGTNFALTQSGSGRVVNGDGADADSSIAGADLTTSLTGTVWGSYLMIPDEYIGLCFNVTGEAYAAPTLSAMTKGRLRLYYDGGNMTTEEDALSAVKDDVSLILFKIDINTDGDNDDVTVWINPDVTDLASETAALTYTGDWVGDSIDRLNINAWKSANDDSGIDLITLSDGVDAYFDVTVPEPATMLLLGLGGLMLKRRRR